MRAIFGDKVYDVIVYKSIRFAEASVASQSILEYAANHKGAVAYRELAQKIAGSEGSSKPAPKGIPEDSRSGR